MTTALSTNILQYIQTLPVLIDYFEINATQYSYYVEAEHL